MDEPAIVAAARNALDSWKFWVAVAYLGLVAGVVVLALTLSRLGDIRADQLREDTVRQATAASALRRCLEGIALSERVNVYLGGVRELAAVLVANAREMPRETPEQWRRLDRLVLAEEAIRALPSFPVDTPGECRARHPAAPGQ